MKQLTVLGSTGSIGCSTLDVVRHNPGRFSVAALVAGKTLTVWLNNARIYPRYAVMDDAQSAERLRTRLHEHGCRTEVLSGQQAAAEVAALDEVDQVMAAIVGAAGLVPTLAAIRAGKTVLLANKESLVTCGRLFMEAVQQSGRDCYRSIASITLFFRVCRRQFSSIWDTLILPGMASRQSC